jgi:hypothetical protein
MAAKPPVQERLSCLLSGHMFWCRVLSEALIEIFGRYFFFFFVGLEFELRALYLSHTSIPFCSGYFGDGGLMKYLLG